MKQKKIKIAALFSHPVYYHTAPLALLPDDFDVTLLFATRHGLDSDYDKEFGVRADFKRDHFSGLSYRFLKNFSLSPSPSFLGQINFGIIPHLFKKRYDFIIVYGWNSLTNWLAFFVAKIAGTRVLLRSESPLNQELLKSAWKRFVKRFILGRILFPIIFGFLYIGEENKKFYLYYGVSKKKLFFAPYAVDNDWFMGEAKRLLPQSVALRAKEGIEPDAFVVLFVGKLIQKKRPMDLLKAFEKFSRQHKKTAHLIFVGDGDLRFELEEYVKECAVNNVHFVGFKNQTELPIYYTISDVFVLPSGEGETWGLVVNEAMCFDLLIVVSDVVGCGGDLVSAGSGSIFPVGDVASCRDALVEMSRKKGNISGSTVKKYSYEAIANGICEAIVGFGGNNTV